MTISLDQSSACQGQSAFLQRVFLKDYVLASGSFTVFSDSIRGVYGVLQEQGKEMHVSFEDFAGIPKKFQFNHGKLEKYLEDTYIKLNRSEGQPITVIFCHRLMGGGNSHSSSHSQSQHYTSPPPPTLINVNYSAGIPIRHLATVPHIVGDYINTTGGEGLTTFSTTFRTSTAGAKPSVIIKVWKKDYHAADIARLQILKASHLQAKTNELAKKQTCESKRNAITSMLTSLQNHQNILKSYQLAQQQLASEIALVETEINKNIAGIASLVQMGEEGYNIRSLIDLLEVCHHLGINMLKPDHVAINQFVARDVSKDVLIRAPSNPKSLLGATVISLSNILSETQKAKDKDIVALVGNTGTGKSTAVNYLLGIPMQFVAGKEGGTVQVANGEQEIAKIGHRLANSETLYTQVYEKNNVPFVIADCGGFFDTRGVSSDMAVATSLKLTLESAKSVKLVACFDAHILTSDRGTLFYETVRLTLESLLENYKAHSSSVLLMLTKPPISLDGVIFSSAEACQIITEIMNDSPEGSKQKELYQFLLRDNGKYICVCDPLSDAKRSNVQQILSEMSSINKPQEAFRVACTANSQVALLEEMMKTAIKANELFNNHSNLSARLAEEQTKLQTLFSKRLALLVKKQEVENAINQNEEFLKNNNLSEVNNTIAAINLQLAALQKEIEDCDTEISLKDNTQFVVYHSNGGEWKIY